MSVLYDRQGPDWPLGLIAVAAPGTPVGIMSLVDPGSLADPSTPTAAGVPEYSARCQQIMFQGVKAAAHGLQVNTGNVYIVRKGGSRDDSGTIVAMLQPGQTIWMASAPAVLDVFSPYRYYVDADNAGDSALVTLLIF
jgi:hypothetical protein